MISLTDNQVPDERMVGPKAASLFRLSSLGFHILPGFVFETTYCDDLIAHAGLQDPVRWLQEHGPLLKEAYVLEFGENIARMLGDAPLPAAFERDLERCFQVLGKGAIALICRSSCLMEDSGVRAFPGIFLSEAGLKSAGELRKAVKNCLGSLFKPKAIRYWLRSQGVDPRFSMGLIVQHFLNCSCSGVMFYWNPETIFIEAVPGGGEMLKSGNTGMVSYRKRLNGAWDDGSNGTKEMNGLLGQERLERLAEVGRSTSEEWGGAVDIEFGFHDLSDNPVIFQCRPITKPFPDQGKGHPAGTTDIHASLGVGCAPGLAYGTAVDPERAEFALKGSSKPIALLECLTERNYDLIFDVQGIVTERVGSQLNHLSIACRELGIPYVSGIEKARTRFHQREVFLDGEKGAVSPVSHDFQPFEERATVAPAAFAEGHLAYLPFFDGWGFGKKEKQGFRFSGGLSLILEALYHSQTEEDLAEFMIHRMGETFLNQKISGPVALCPPCLSPEEFSILNQSMPGSSFSSKILDRIFQKVCEEVKRRYGISLVYEPRLS